MAKNDESEIAMGEKNRVGNTEMSSSDNPASCRKIELCWSREKGAEGIILITMVDNALGYGKIETEKG